MWGRWECRAFVIIAKTNFKICIFSLILTLLLVWHQTPALQKGLWRDVHSSTHLRVFFGSGGSRAANIASSNTFFRPFWKGAKRERGSLIFEFSYKKNPRKPSGSHTPLRTDGDLPSPKPACPARLCTIAVSSSWAQHLIFRTRKLILWEQTSVLHKKQNTRTKVISLRQFLWLTGYSHVSHANDKVESAAFRWKSSTWSTSGTTRTRVSVEERQGKHAMITWSSTCSGWASSPKHPRVRSSQAEPRSCHGSREVKLGGVQMGTIHSVKD